MRQGLGQSGLVGVPSMLGRRGALGRVPQTGRQLSRPPPVLPLQGEGPSDKALFHLPPDRVRANACFTCALTLLEGPRSIAERMSSNHKPRPVGAMEKLRDAVARLDRLRHPEDLSFTRDGAAIAATLQPATREAGESFQGRIWLFGSTGARRCSSRRAEWRRLAALVTKGRPARVHLRSDGEE